MDAPSGGRSRGSIVLVATLLIGVPRRHQHDRARPNGVTIVSKWRPMHPHPVIRARASMYAGRAVLNLHVEDIQLYSTARAYLLVNLDRPVRARWLRLYQCIYSYDAIASSRRRQLQLLQQLQPRTYCSYSCTVVVHTVQRRQRTARHRRVPSYGHQWHHSRGVDCSSGSSSLLRATEA
eukprot:SAG31_NODE_451_length_15511_cov_77.547301_9_plen_179_part_00